MSPKPIPVIRQNQPKPRTNRKIIFLLLIFFMIVFIILFLRSSVSKISRIDVENNQMVPTSTIVQALPVKVGDNFFLQSSSSIRQTVVHIPAVKSAKISKIFPGVIRIRVNEYPQVAYELDSNGTKEAVLANGSKITLQRNTSIDKPVLHGWTSRPQLEQKLCQALAKIPPDELTDISEIEPVPTIGFPDKIKMYTNTHFEVITAIHLMPHKISYLEDYIAGQPPGTITMLLTDYYGPYKYHSSGNHSQSEAP